MRKSKYSTIKLILIFLVLGATMLCCNIVLVSGDSMNPTYKHGDILLATKSTDINKNDVVVFKQSDEVFIKRVYAVPGDTIEIIDNGIYINGIKLSQYSCEQDDCKFVLEDGEYYLLGDNCNNSVDSRSFGCVPKSRIISKVVIRLLSVG